MNIRMAVAGDGPALIEFNQSMALETEGKQLDAAVLARGVTAVSTMRRKGFTLSRTTTARLPAD